MTPTTPTTPTHTLPTLASEGGSSGNGSVNSAGKKEKQPRDAVDDLTMEIAQVPGGGHESGINLGVGVGVGDSRTNSTPSSAAPSDEDEARSSPSMSGRRRHHHSGSSSSRRHRPSRSHQSSSHQILSQYPPSTSTSTSGPFPSAMAMSVGLISPYTSSPSSPSTSSLSTSSLGSSSPPSPASIPPAPVIPSQYPLITRETLKELELEVTLRSPQLRHDLLFDPGLQFRPTSGRRKREQTERYWEAVAREVQFGCVCASFERDFPHRMYPCVCGKVPLGTGAGVFGVTDVPLHPAWIPMACSTQSRVGLLLETLKEVLHLVIHPANTSSISASSSSSSGPSTPLPTTAASSPPVHADPLLQMFDPALIKQELAHGVFDYKSVFRWVGDVMKTHCAPMRDAMVESMVKLVTEGEGEGEDAARKPVLALRMCFEILEIMKLDIANHQLQALRPYLLETSPDFELKTFQERFEKGVTGLNITRRWISRPAATAITAAPPGVRMDKPKMVMNALCAAMVDLVFQPPIPSSRPTEAPVLDTSKGLFSGPPRPLNESGIPETLYLDQARIASYVTDAADLLGLYMLIMLFRQLATVVPSTGVALEDWEIERVKREVWEIGPNRLGLCFDVTPPVPSGSGSDPKAKWDKGMNDVTLQIAVRAEDARERMTRPKTASNGMDVDSTSSTTQRVPSPNVLALIEKWKKANYTKDSPLCSLLKRRLQAAVLEAVTEAVSTTASNSDPVNGPRQISPRTNSSLPMRKINRHPIIPPSSTASPTLLKKTAGSGVEALMPEILHLGDRIARLVAFHAKVYGKLYEIDGFIDPSLA